MPSSASLAQLAGTVTEIALAGNPNSGKSTLFNALTGLRQKVANYPGVTVEKKTGRFYGVHGKPMDLLDLPGTYSLQTRSPDEEVCRDVLLGRRNDTPPPPIIGAAMRFMISEPEPSLHMIGNSPKRIAAMVIILGRMRCTVPSFTAEIRSLKLFMTPRATWSS
jgi:energy-coupling factor transporter ATP-binding protein EcfA2